MAGTWWSWSDWQSASGRRWQDWWADNGWGWASSWGEANAQQEQQQTAVAAPDRAGAGERADAETQDEEAAGRRTMQALDLCVAAAAPVSDDDAEAGQASSTGPWAAVAAPAASSWARARYAKDLIRPHGRDERNSDGRDTVLPPQVQPHPFDEARVCINCGVFELFQDRTDECCWVTAGTRCVFIDYDMDDGGNGGGEGDDRHPPSRKRTIQELNEQDVLDDDENDEADGEVTYRIDTLHTLTELAVWELYPCICEKPGEPFVEVPGERRPRCRECLKPVDLPVARGVEGRVAVAEEAIEVEASAGVADGSDDDDKMNGTDQGPDGDPVSVDDVVDGLRL